MHRLSVNDFQLPRREGVGESLRSVTKFYKISKLIDASYYMYDLLIESCVDGSSMLRNK